MQMQRVEPTQSAQVSNDLNKAGLALGSRVGLFFLFLAISLVVTVVGHSAWIPDEWRLAARAGLSLVLLATTIGLHRSERLRPFWKISLAYLAVSVGFLLTLIVGRWLPPPDSLASSPIMGLALGKLFDVVPLVLPMLLVPTLAGDDFGSIYLQRGKLGQSLLLGMLVGAVTFIPFVMLGGLEGVRAVGAAAVVAALPWIAVFSLSNSFMEELWWRGLFLRKYQVFLGARGALLLTALGWGLMHLIVSYFAGGQLLAFVVTDILLGLAYGWITQRTDTLWGAVLAHAAADAFLVLGMLATLAKLG
jgi:membrane protease YdiL (CAAX protease family)